MSRLIYMKKLKINEEKLWGFSSGSSDSPKEGKSHGFRSKVFGGWLVSASDTQGFGLTLYLLNGTGIHYSNKVWVLN